MAKRLTGRDINGKRIVVEVQDKAEEARTKRAYAKVGIALEAEQSWIKKEAKRLIREASE